MQKEAKARLLVTLQFGLLFALVIAAQLSSNTSYLPATTTFMVLGLMTLGFAYLALLPSLRISPIPKDGAEFISVGIYRFVRHPMYLGLLLIGFSLAVNADDAMGWIIYLILMVVLNIKANFEDFLLRELHPESVHYQMHTSKILPCLGGSCRDNCEIS
jgi:protein-S-isoprenylcysteine O-methyltransferase Ste14